MLLRARDDMGIDLAASYMIGDSVRDVEAGHRAGCTTVLVRTGYGRGEWEYQSDAWEHRPDLVCENLLEAVKSILNR